MPLPTLIPDRKLVFSHFPTSYQCVIFRNWGMVPPERIGRVIGADVNTVRREAADLGLPPSSGNEDQWLTKGYITIIRQNWHILSYDQLCILLDWTAEKLDFILKEDDFLDVKLGNFKPGVEDCTIRPLTEAEREKTARIRRLTEEAFAKLPEKQAKPFDFAPCFSTDGWRTEIAESRFEERYLYSFCALYGDTFADRALLDASFPDELLASYRDLGITGVWTHVILYTVVKYPFDGTMSEGYETRQAGMRYLTEKLARYGLKLFLYFNEPRAMANEFFDNHPHLKGHTMGAYSALCINTPEVADYLRGGVAELCRAVPLLGGFFTITASENMTNCHSHAQNDNCTCPRCAGLSNAEVFGRVNQLIVDGVKDAQSGAKVIAWSWGWREDHFDEIIEHLPPEAAVMNVSEQGVKKCIGGVETSVLDYSISIEGPGALARHVWEKAHETGHKGYGKMQMNNSWEIAAVPFLPVLERFYRHISRLVTDGEANPDGLMLSWSLGGFPSPVLKLLSLFYDRTKPIPTFTEVCEKLYPACDTAKIEGAVHAFSEAFDQYPFHISTAYVGPQLYAPANLLWDKPTGFGATMVGFPYDHLDAWRSIFPREVYREQLRRLSDGWNQGMALLEQVEPGRETPEFGFLYRCAALAGYHFRSMLLQTDFVIAREKGEDTAAIKAEEGELSMKAAALIAADPTLAYESSNHYFYTVNGLIEKMIALKFS